MKQKYFVWWCLSIISFLPLHAQIVNEGTLKISTSTIVYFGDEYTNQASGSHENGGDLYLNNNFINNGLTTSSSGTTYFNSSNLDIQSISGLSNSINFYNLEVNLTSASKKGLSVDDQFGLTVENSLSLISGDLRLLGDAQLVQTHAGANSNPVGLGKLLLDQQGIASVHGFNYWSSPVNIGGTHSLAGGLYDGTDAAINPFSPAQVTFNSSGNFNGTPSVVDGVGNVTTPLSVNKRWLFKHYQPTSWAQIDETTNLSPGLGYTMKGTNTPDTEQNYVFKGDPNNGAYQLPVTSGEFLLLGNPFPSAIDSPKFIADNIALIDALYFWVDGGSTSHYTSNYLGGYAIRNLVTGVAPSLPAPLILGLGDAHLVTPPTQYMDVAQGFFIEAKANGNITFDNSHREIRTASSGSVNFYRTLEENSIIRIGYEDPEGFHRQLALGFMPNSGADMNYNPGYDALMIDPRDDELFFIIENDLDKKYVIQGVGAFDELIEIRLGLIISEVGTHTIMLDEVENFTSPVFIKDNVLNTTYNLSEGNYLPALSPGEYLDRFSMVFQSQTLQTNIFLQNEIKVYYTNKNLIVKNPNSILINKVTILNELGQVIQSKVQGLTDNKIIIPFDQKAGLYLINLESDEQLTTYKILNY